MGQQNTIEHAGIVQSFDDKHVKVLLESHPSCSGCMASGICDVSGQDDKVISALRTDEVRSGDRVKVILERSLGFKALFLGYLLPFLLILVLLVLLTSFRVSEITAGAISLCSLVPYYLLLWARRKKIGRSFTFTIKNQNK